MERLGRVTHDRDDFLALAEEYRGHKRFHAGMIIAVRRPPSPHELAAKLRWLMNELTADERGNQVYYI